MGRGPGILHSLGVARHDERERWHQRLQQRPGRCGDSIVQSAPLHPFGGFMRVPFLHFYWGPKQDLCFQVLWAREAKCGPLDGHVLQRYRFVFTARV